MNNAIHASRTAITISGINRGWMLALGILMVGLGFIGLGMTYALAVAVLFWSGILALIAGAGHLLDAFHHKQWRGVAGQALIGAVYIFVGFMLTAMPTISAIWVARFIAIALILTGLSRVVIMIRTREDQRSIMLLLSGFVAWALGIYIFELVTFPDPEVFATAATRAAWVSSWKWIIGLFVAIELLAEGVALIAISLSPERRSR